MTERTYSRIKTRPAPTPTPTPAPTPSYVDAGADETYESIAEAGGPSPGTLRMMEALSAADDDDAVDEEGDAAYAHSYSPVVFPPAMEAEVVDAELVPHNQAEIIHAVSPFKVDSRITQLFEPLPNTLSPEQAEILLVLRGAFSKSRANLKPSLEFYPSEFEDWAVECFSGQRPDEKKTFAVFFETFMSDGANVLRNDAIQVLGKMRYHDGKTNGSRFLNVSVVLRDTSYQIDQADVHCAPLNGKQHYPLLYNHLVFMSIKTIISMVAEQYGGIEYEDPIKHLLARFYSRHDPLETAYRFLHGSFQTTTCQHTWNCILENVLAFSLNGNNVEERYQIVDEVMSTMFRREMMIDTLCFTKVLKFHATFGNPKQGLGLLKLITAKQRMYIPPESWSDISSLYEQTSSFKVAYGLLSSLKERCIEEFGHVQMRDCLKFQKFSFTRVDRRDERFPELQRGDLRKAVLPIKFTINLFMNLLHLSAVQGNLEALLEDVKEYFKWYGSKRTHDLRTFDVADPPYSEMSRNSAVLSRIALCKIVKDPTEGIAFLKDYVFGKDVVLLPDILVIISDILSKYIRDLVKEEKAVLRKKRGRGHGTIPLSGEQTEAQKLAIYLVTELNSHVVDAAGMRTSKYRRTKHAKASLTSEPLYSLCVLKMALHSESASLVNDCFREHYQSCKRIAQPVDGGLVIKTMKLYGANGWWRTAESLVYDLFPARRRQRVLDRSSGTSYFKIINELIAAHVSSKKEALDPLSSRSMRVIELAFQTVVKGDVLEYQHLSEVCNSLEFLDFFLFQNCAVHFWFSSKEKRNLRHLEHKKKLALRGQLY